jgi:hypothetical protein
MNEDRTHKILVIVSWVIYAVIGGGIYFLTWLVRKDQSPLTIFDGLSVGGIMVILSGLLTVVNRFGAFDALSYGARMFAVHINPKFDPKNDKYQDYNDYRVKKSEERRKYPLNFLPWTVIGGGMFIAALIVRFTMF